MGISFLGTAFSEPTLIKLASGYEAFTQVLQTCRSSSITRHRIRIRGMTSGQEIDAAEAAKRVEDTDKVDPAKAKRKPQGL